MRHHQATTFFLAVIFGQWVFMPALASEPPARQLYWGDTHLHTAYSFDASLSGTTLKPADAYRFARGEAVTTTLGRTAKLRRPLDFLVVADHAEYLGAMRLIRAADAQFLKQPNAKRLYDLMNGMDPDQAPLIMLEMSESYDTGVPFLTMPAGTVSPWQELTAYADEANAPGEFTAFIGFEWSSMPQGNNLHRVVVFRDDARHANQVTPLSALDSNDPAALWRYLGDYAKKTGGEALAIPHNSNVSGGLMFTETQFDGQPMTAEYARQRIKFEPIMEVTQIKGDSETHPLLSPNDEFADYGTWDKWNIAMSSQQQPWMYPAQYARSALKTGLLLQSQLGVNPYAFGMIGSTDSHTALAAIEEDAYGGKFIANEPPNPKRASKDWGSRGPDKPVIYTWEELASGYAAVWAESNTRDAIFAAMQRREVYATTGPRMSVRVFGGWDFTTADASDPSAAALGYRKGVPMGGNLTAAPDTEIAPRFLITALKDPDGAHLDRIQVVKGWLANDGETLHEKVYDVAWSGSRQPDASGKLPPVGDTVDRATGHYSNTIGSVQLATVWTDPDFNPALQAFYYVRVLEIPTPRWPLYDKIQTGAEILPGTTLVHQERAYTSPIWYTPQ